MGLFPVVLPLQKIEQVGMTAFPEGQFFWNILGSSTIISIFIIAKIVGQQKLKIN